MPRRDGNRSGYRRGEKSKGPSNNGRYNDRDIDYEKRAVMDQAGIK